MAAPETLQDAVMRDDPAAVAARLDEGAPDLCERDGEPWSWLAESLRLGHGRAALAFLSHPRRLGSESEAWAMVGLLEGPHDDAEMAGMLLDRGCFLLRRPSGPPIEHIVASSSHRKIAAELFRRGLLRNDPADAAGFAPLHRAVQAGDMATASLFLENGAPLNAVVAPPDGRGVLHLALEPANRNAMVAWLLDLGTDTRTLDGEGKTAADRAREKGCDHLAGLIKERSAEGGPRWHREAVRAGMRDIVSAYYDKADGFCFNPHDVSRPFLIGGDYGGAFPETARTALSFARQCDPKSELGRAVRPWIKVIERMVEGDDVSLSEILPLGRLTGRP